MVSPYHMCDRVYANKSSTTVLQLRGEKKRSSVFPSFLFEDKLSVTVIGCGRVGLAGRKNLTGVSLSRGPRMRWPIRARPIFARFE